MLAYFVEKFSGLKLEEYMRQNIFRPLGMTSTSQDNLAQQLKAQPNQVSNYYDYTDLSQSYDFFAYGNAASTEVNQGVQTGAGGFFQLHLTWFDSTPACLSPEMRLPLYRRNL